MLTNVNCLLFNYLRLALLSAVRSIALALVAITCVATLLVEWLLRAMYSTTALFLDNEIRRAAQVGRVTFHRLTLFFASDLVGVLADVV